MQQAIDPRISVPTAAIDCAPTADRVHQIAGWFAPAWADRHVVETDANDNLQIEWSYDAADVLACNVNGVDGPFTPFLFRIDGLKIEIGERRLGEMRLSQGRTLIHVGDDLDVSPSEARKLAAALIALADRVDSAGESSCCA